MSVIQVPGFLYATTLCELANSDPSLLNVGCLAYVVAENAYYRLMDYPAPAVPPAPDGSNIISTIYGPDTPDCDGFNGSDVRRWILTDIGDASGQAFNELAWYVDSVNGNDDNVGTDPNFPVQTVREIGERWRRGAGYNTLGPVYVYIISDRLLETDAFVIDRPVYPGNPIIFEGNYGNTRTSNATVLSDIIDEGAGADPNQPLAAKSTFLLPDNALVQCTIAGTVYTAQVIGDDAKNVGWKALTSFYAPASSADPLNPTYLGTIADPTNALVLGRGCLAPDNFAINIPPEAQIIFNDFTFSHSNTPPSPYVTSDVQSGTLIFVRCTSSDQLDATPSIRAREQVAISFMSSPAGFTVTSFGERGVFLFNSIYALTTASNMGSVEARERTIFNGTSRLIGSPRIVLADVGVYNTSHPTGAVRVNGGTLYIDGALFGYNNDDVLLSLANYARGQYTSEASLTVADETLVAYSATIDYQNGVTKTFDAADLPFISNATFDDSQAGMLKV